MHDIKILHGAMDGSKWLEIYLEEYEQNYTDKINYTYAVSQDDGKVRYYKREVPKEYNESSEIKNERMED